MKSKIHELRNYNCKRMSKKSNLVFRFIIGMFVVFISTTDLQAQTKAEKSHRGIIQKIRP